MKSNTQDSYGRFYSMKFYHFKYQLIALILLFQFIPVEADYEITWACYSDPFTDKLCHQLLGVIEVTEAVYAASFCAGTGLDCCPNLSDCNIIISSNNPDYFAEIKEACDGKQSCTNLTAGHTAALGQCNEAFTDYVAIYYECVRAPLTTTPSEDLNDTLTTAKPDDSSALAWAIPVGIIIGLSIFLIPAAIYYVTRMRGEKGGNLEISLRSCVSDDSFEEVKKKPKPPKSVPVSQNQQTSAHGKQGSIQRQDSTECFGDNIYESIEIDNNSPSIRKQSKKSKARSQEKVQASLLSNANSDGQLTACNGASDTQDFAKVSAKECEYQNTPTGQRKSPENIYQNTPTMKRKVQLELSKDSTFNKEDTQENCYTNATMSENGQEKDAAAAENIYIDVIADDHTADNIEIYQNQNFEHL